MHIQTNLWIDEPESLMAAQMNKAAVTSPNCRLMPLSLHRFEDPSMNEDILNTGIRKFLRQVGVTSQQEIEKAVQAAIKEGSLSDSEPLAATMTLEISALSLTHRIDGRIALDTDDR